VKFNDLNISDQLLEALGYMGFETPTEIQAKAIPEILNRKDIIGCAQTGTGKTGAFLIPLLEKLSQTKGKGIRTLIVVPTRELALQIDEQVQALSYFLGVSSIPVYGGGEGASFSQQKTAIQEGADILIATPGRLIAHMNLGYVDLSHLEFLVLDEADRMLDMGFIDDITKIIKECPKDRQTLMFSATMATQIRLLAKQVLKDPVQINLAIAKPAAGIDQQVYMVYDPKKVELLNYIVEHTDVTNMIVFASRKESVDQIERQLKRSGHSVSSLHSGRTQEERQDRLREFKAGKIQILVATDVLSRGIDIDGLSHVVNFNIPNDAADYVHRIGRTARADKSGTAISFLNEEDQLKFLNIEELIERKLEKKITPEEIGPSPEYNPEKFLRRGKSQSGKGGGGKRHFKGKSGGRNRNSKGSGGNHQHGRNRNQNQGKGHRSQKGGGNQSKNNS
jgi:ATP-dependent RNA helicase RhlE